MVPQLLMILFALGALVIAVAIAFLPLRAVVAMIGRNIAEPIRAFIERRRDRRAAERTTPDRRQV